jgi:hypothetical protein
VAVAAGGGRSSPAPGPARHAGLVPTIVVRLYRFRDKKIALVQML